MKTAALAHPLAGRSVLKMNGIGNAIVILDLRGTNIVPTPDDARAIAAAPGLAYDQLMVVRDAQTPDADAFMMIYNADGSRAGACGNGTRCVAWALTRDDDREALTLATDAGPLACRRLPDGHFSVDMGAPRFRWDEIPLEDASLDPRALDLSPGDPRLPPAFALSMGNPHAVLFVDDIDAFDLAAIGPRLETAPVFPDRANISLAQVVSPRAIRLKVWERGAGATLACGSAACATLVAAAATGRTERAATIALPGGSLDIAWGQDDHVVMTGPVTYEFARVLDAALFEALAA